MSQDYTLPFNEQKCFKNPILAKIQKGAYDFFYSNWFFLLMAVVVVLSWVFEIVELAFVFVAIVSTITWFFMDDISPFIACFFCIPYIFPLDIHVENYLHIIPILVPVVIGVVFHIFYYSPKKFVKGKYLYPQLAVTIALIMGGLGSYLSPSQYAHGLGQIVQLGPLLLLIYMAMANYLTVRGESQAVYFSKMFMTTSLILTVEIFLYILLNTDLYLEQSELNLGIVNSNGASTIIMISIPFTFYMILKRPKYVIPLYIFSAIQYLALFATLSRGCILFAIITLPINVFYTISKSPKKKELIIMFVLEVIAVVVLAIIKREKIAEIFAEVFKNLNMDSLDEFTSGRITMWNDGWTNFAKYPAFGVGLGHVGECYVPGLSGTYWYHSTIVQVIACTGIFGTLLYIYNYFMRFKIVCKGMKRNSFKVFALSAMIGFEGYSLVNNGTFLAIPAMLMITCLTFMCEKTDAYLDVLEGKN